MVAKCQVDRYFKALERLKARGEVINNDAVAKEAGSGKGSIKKSRKVHAELHSAIQRAAFEQKQAKVLVDPTLQLREENALLKQKLNNALEREICLLDEVYSLREENLQLKQGRLTIVSKKVR